jgi:transposase/macrodomain Ter protein organizer (MatP/YcbG family)
MDYIRGASRTQVILFPETVEDYITEDNPVRFIDAFVASLDLAELGFNRAQPAETGRPAYDPADLLRLYLYGYLNRVRSSRMLEREAKVNLEVMWLLGKLAPDFKTIADFRRDNLKAIKAVCREFTLLCRKLKLFGGELVAIDGSKFKAVNNRRRNFSEARLTKAIKAMDEKISAYLNSLDRADAADPDPDEPGPSAAELREKIETLQQRKAKYQALKQELKESGAKQVSLTDRDARSMVMHHGSTEVGYNVQTVVDEQHQLIVEHEVTNDPTDHAHLAEMALRAKATLGVEQLEVVADMGYYDGAEVKQCAEAGITTYIPKPITSINKKRGLFIKQDFVYDPAKDCYRCPAGAELTYRYESFEQGRQIRYYTTAKCADCPIKEKCTTNQRGRRITRWVDEKLLEDMARRVRARPEMMRRRQQLSEPPFGTIKRGMNQGYFLMRGLSKVGAEMSLTVLSYNIKRVINLIGVKKMIAALT